MGRLAFLTFLLLWITACSGSDEGDGSPSTSDSSVGTSTSEVGISLSEWSVTASPDSVVSGQVIIKASNEGTKSHNLLIVKDIAPADLPTESRGYVAEAEIPEGALIDQLPAFDAGATQSATFALAPGNYTIFCNVVDDFGSHFAAGMVETVEVTG